MSIGPQAIGLGMRRSGSSWLHRLLNAQSNIEKPINGLHFFSENYEHGISWYKQHFSVLRASYALEMSITYGYPEHAEECSERIFSDLGRVKLFCTLREPIDRAYSDYLRALRMSDIPDISFQQALKHYPAFLERGLYSKILEPYLTKFGRENIHIIFYEDLHKDVEHELSRLFKFLGCGFNRGEIPVSDVKMKWGRPRSQKLNKAIFAVKESLDYTALYLGSEKAWESTKSVFRRPYQKLIARLSRQTTMKPEVRKELQGYFGDDVRTLENQFDIQTPWFGYHNREAISKK